MHTNFVEIETTNTNNYWMFMLCERVMWCAHPSEAECWAIWIFDFRKTERHTIHIPHQRYTHFLLLSVLSDRKRHRTSKTGRKREEKIAHTQVTQSKSFALDKSNYRIKYAHQMLLLLLLIKFSSSNQDFLNKRQSQSRLYSTAFVISLDGLTCIFEQNQLITSDYCWSAQLHV